MINNLEPIFQTFATWPSLHSQSSSRLCNTTFAQCCQSWEKFGIFRRKKSRRSLQYKYFQSLPLTVSMSFSPLVLENEVIGAAPTYHVIRYLTLFGNIDQCRGPSRKDKDHLHSWVTNWTIQGMNSEQLSMSAKYFCCKTHSNHN